MDLYQFKLLNHSDQAQAVWDFGVHVATRYSSHVTILLWQLDCFYVELFYDGIENEIVKIRPFKSTLPLDPYLQQTDVTTLLI